MLKRECPDAWEKFKENGTLVSDLSSVAKGGYHCLENEEVPNFAICLYHMRSAVKRHLHGVEHKEQRAEIYSMILESDKSTLEMKLLRHSKKYEDDPYFVNNYGWSGQWPPSTWSKAYTGGSISTTMRAGTNSIKNLIVLYPCSRD